jgi:2'-5' RNA ligase
VRRQVALFVPEPVASAIDAVRREWDPEMAGAIAPHVTVLHRCDDPAAVAAAATSVDPFEVTVGVLDCWGRPSGGLYLTVDDPSGGVTRLRERLGVREPFTPHVTVVHRRSLPSWRAGRRAWRALAGWELEASVVLDAVTVIEADDAGGPWRQVAVAPLGS